MRKGNPKICELFLTHSYLIVVMSILCEVYESCIWQCHIAHVFSQIRINKKRARIMSATAFAYH